MGFMKGFLHFLVVLWIVFNFVGFVGAGPLWLVPFFITLQVLIGVLGFFMLGIIIVPGLYQALGVELK